MFQPSQNVKELIENWKSLRNDAWEETKTTVLVVNAKM